MSKKALYICGPMRGRPLYNIQAFCEAAMTLRDEDYFIYSPAERDIATGFQPHLAMDHPDQCLNLDEAFTWDFWAIAQSDGIVLLPGWEDSEGTKKEIVLAQGMGKLIYLYNSGFLEPVNPTLKVSVIE